MRTTLLTILGLTISSTLLFSQECWENLDDPVEIKNQHRNHVMYDVGTLRSFSNSSSRPAENYSLDGQDIFSLGFARSIWAGGFDALGNLSLAANTYPNLNSHDYGPGPILSDPALYEEFCLYYNRAWRVTRSEIDILKAAYNSGMLEQGDIPIDILEWPANGNPHMGIYAPSEDMAPFHDLDNDGIYNPINGDHPIVLTENADFIPKAFVFTVYNDNRVHSETNGQPLRMEFHQMSYVVDCREDLESNSTVFTRLKYVYKGTEDMMQFKLGVWSDDDFGCLINDHVGCDTTLNSMYTYNRDGNDASSSNECSFLNTIPDKHGAVQTLVSLNHSIKSFISFNRISAGSPDPNTTDPGSPIEYYNYLSGRWRNSDPITVGGSGFNPGSTDTTKFMFPDLPTDMDGWSMQNNDVTIVDPRIMATLVESDNLSPGQIGVIDYADHILYDEREIGLDVFNEWGDHIQTLKSEFEGFKTGVLNCEPTSTEESAYAPILGMKIYPNPSNDVIHLELKESAVGTVRCINLLGKEIFSLRIENEKELEIDISGLPVGSYLLDLKTVNGESLVEAFVRMD